MAPTDKQLAEEAHKALMDLCASSSLRSPLPSLADETHDSPSPLNSSATLGAKNVADQFEPSETALQWKPEDTGMADPGVVDGGGVASRISPNSVQTTDSSFPTPPPWRVDASLLVDLSAPLYMRELQDRTDSFEGSSREACLAPGPLDHCFGDGSRGRQAHRQVPARTPCRCPFVGQAYSYLATASPRHTGVEVFFKQPRISPFSIVEKDDSTRKDGQAQWHPQVPLEKFRVVSEGAKGRAQINSRCIALAIHRHGRDNLKPMEHCVSRKRKRPSVDDAGDPERRMTACVELRLRNGRIAKARLDSRSKFWFGSERFLEEMGEDYDKLDMEPIDVPALGCAFTPLGVWKTAYDFAVEPDGEREVLVNVVRDIGADMIIPHFALDQTETYTTHCKRIQFEESPTGRLLADRAKDVARKQTAFKAFLDGNAEVVGVDLGSEVGVMRLSSATEQGLPVVDRYHPLNGWLKFGGGRMKPVLGWVTRTVRFGERENESYEELFALIDDSLIGPDILSGQLACKARVFQRYGKYEVPERSETYGFGEVRYVSPTERYIAEAIRRLVSGGRRQGELTPEEQELRILCKKWREHEVLLDKNTDDWDKDDASFDPSDDVRDWRVRWKEWWKDEEAGIITEINRIHQERQPRG